MVALASGPGQPLLVQVGVDRVCSAVARVALAPELDEATVVVVAAERTRAVAGGERRRLVEEEELAEAPRTQERAAPPTTEGELAGDPTASTVGAPDRPARVVQAAAVAVDEAARRVCDQLAERCDAVLERLPARGEAGDGAVSAR
jgi:hypothetical protein